MAERVVVGLSGGVDSSVSALLLKQQGYDVIGVFMKNWDEKETDGPCTAATDWQDVQQIAETIGIPCYAVNFEKEYYDRVFTYFLDEYRKGRTPNPDVLCNREIKFKAFLQYALSLGAEKIATGHFVNTELRDGHQLLLRGADPGKDQSYFLYMLKEAQLARSIFPVGNLTKAQVREIAAEHGLCNAAKKDSTGVCFIGERNFRQFLQNYLPMMPGDMLTEDGEKVGEHIGLCYYTLGQRRGLNIGGRGTGERWFVVDKDLKNNILRVSQGEDSPKLYSRYTYADQLTWIAGKAPADDNVPFTCTAKFRYRQPDQEVEAIFRGDKMLLRSVNLQRAVTPGQSIVLYHGDICLGGGITESAGMEPDTRFEDK